MIENYYELTHPQKRIWYTEQFNPASSVSNIAFTTKLKGKVDTPLLAQVINRVIQKNSGMRLQLIEVDQGGELQLQQFVVDYTEREIDFFDFTGDDGEERYRQWAEVETRRPFALLNSPLFYCAILQLNGESDAFYIKMHHIISDGWTLSLITNDVVRDYHDVVAGVEVSTAKNADYLDYLDREQVYLQSTEFTNDRTFWHEQFKSLPLEVQLSLYKKKSDDITSNRHLICVPTDLRLKVEQFCREYSTSFYRLFLTVLYMYIAKVTGEKDVVIGIPHHNRLSKQEKNTVGMFTSTVPLRVCIDEETSFLTCLQGINSQLQVTLKKHQQFPYDQLMLDLREKHKTVGDMLSVTLTYYGMNNQGHEKEFHCRKNLPNSLAIFINPNAKDESVELELAFDYRVALFSLEDIMRLSARICSLLQVAITAPDQKIVELEMLPEAEKKQIMRSFNATHTTYPHNKTIHELFAQQALRTPEHSALIYKEQYLTYAQLNAKANQLAWTLRQSGVGPEVIVGIMVERSLDMLVGILGILKAGGGYLPLDPMYPTQRIEYMLQDSGTQYLLTQAKLVKEITFTGLVIDVDDARVYQDQCEELPCVNQPTDIAYIIYTSGSTGLPKGVMIEHRSVVNFIQGITDKIDFAPQSSILCLTTISFDIFGLETLLPLSKGLTVVLASDEQQDPVQISELIENQHIDIVQMTPSRMQLLESSGKIACLKNVSAILLGGEPLPPSLLNKVQAATRGKIYNVYGPTETTIWSTLKELTDATMVTIGSPIANTTIYILDQQGHILPIGAVGELCIAGAGVARGYWQRPELTEEKFIPNGFTTEGKIYKTGDLARWLPNGDIECLGRLDHQVKIRGYRIETGEVANCLLQYPLIQEAVVVDQVDRQGERYLCAYLVVKHTVLPNTLREYVQQSLPEYMVPSYFIEVEKLPLTPNGKIDRKALPDPHGLQKSEVVYEAPRNAIEKTLVALWQQVLETKRIGINDEFLALGGHSLKAIRIIASIHKVLQVAVSLKAFFAASTIKNLADYCAGATRNDYVMIPKAVAQEYYPLAAAQRRVYFLTHFSSNPLYYNIPVTIELEGHLDQGKFTKVLQTVVDRHEMLRTAFVMHQGHVVQKIQQTIQIAVEYVEMMDEPPQQLQEMAEEFIQPFDLVQAPLMRVKLLKTAKNKYTWLMDIHHSIADGVSISILLQEFMTLYQGERALPEVELRYRDYAVWQNRLSLQAELQQQKKYWQQVFSGEIPVLQLPTDAARPDVHTFAGEHIQFLLEPVWTQRINALARTRGVTDYVVLMAIFSIVLSKYSAQEDIVIGTVTSGRSQVELQQTVGMFVNTLAIRTLPQQSKPFQGFLEEVQEKILAAFENQEYQFDDMVKALQVPRDASRNPLFDVMFIMDHVNEPSGKMGELYLKSSTTSAEYRVAKVDMTVHAKQTEQGLVFDLSYYTAIFTKRSMECFIERFIHIIQQVVDRPILSLGQIELVTPQEKERVLAFNNATLSKGLDKTIHELVEIRAQERPEAIAIRCGAAQLTYRQLNEKANQLGIQLRRKGIGAESIVGMMLNRSPEMMIAILGILKAGGTYLPIDPSYPMQRIKYILGDSGAEIVISNRHVMRERDYTIEAEVFLLGEQQDSSGLAQNLSQVNKVTDVAYVIYTSGSTGEPKGVMIEHRAAVNLQQALAEKVEYLPGKTILALASIGFDMAVPETLLAMAQGLTVIMADETEQQEIGAFCALLSRQKINVLQITPSRLQLLHYAGEFDCLQEIDDLLIGAEAFPKNLWEQLSAFSHVKLYNIYGPTETTVWSTLKRLRPDEAVTLGQPLANTHVYIMNQHGQLQPAGFVGELCIGGQGVARGYLNRPELMAEKFMVNPFLSQERMYKTGDLARWLPNGELEYIGRSDNQVKIRGYRIELGEIEKRLLSYPDIKEVVVIGSAQDIVQAYLCAYIIAEQEIVVGEIREFLRQALPEYMIPAYFVQLPTMPLTPNGKINRKALPRPQEHLKKETTFKAPQNVLEMKLLQAWQAVLGVDAIGVDDNFFEVGGDSMSAILLVARLEKEKMKLRVNDLFQYSTIRLLAHYIQERASREQSSLLKKSSLPSATGGTYPSSRVRWLPARGEQKRKQELPIKPVARLFCLPYAGGSATVYVGWDKFLHSGIELCLVELRGRGNRYHEPAAQTFDELITDVYQAIQPQLDDLPYAIFGHSLGGLLAYELGRMIRQAGKPEPTHVFLSGTTLPSQNGQRRRLAQLPDEEFKNVIYQLGGISEEVMSNEAIWEIMMPILRADFLAIESYAFAKNEKKQALTCGITVLNGQDDQSRSELQEWQSYAQECTVEMFAGGHFFINSHIPSIVGLINNFFIRRLFNGKEPW